MTNSTIEQLRDNPAEQDFRAQMGARMKRQREVVLRISQREAATGIDVPEDTYGSWERGYRMVPTNRLADVAKVLGMSVLDLLGLARPSPLDREEQTLIEVRRQIKSPQLRRALLDHALTYRATEQEMG